MSKFVPDPKAAQEKLKKALTMIEDGVTALRNSEAWQQFLAFQARFHRYSFGNCMLIQLQCPHATYVAGFRTWEKMGRHVRKGEKGIAILAPSSWQKTVQRKRMNEETGEEEIIEEVVTVRTYRVVYVFDISQTEGKEVPLVACALKGDDTQDLFDALLRFAQERGIPVSYEDCGAAHGYYSPLERRIVLNSKDERNQQTKTLAHEIGHALLHGDCDTREALDRADRELEAESVAYVVCQAFGFDSGEYSFGYLAAWSQAKDFTERMRILGERIQNAAKAIIDGISENKTEADKEEVA